MKFINYLHHLDQNITLWINSFHCDFSDSVWMLFSDRNIWILMYVIIAAALFVRLGWKKALIVLASVGLTVGACDQFANLIKDSVCRLRPSWDSYMLLNGLHRLEWQGSFYGFFSAHAANSFGVATCASMGFHNDRRKRSEVFTWILYIWAVLVSLSRIFAGKHFFGDVLVGVGVGLLFGWILGSAARWIINNYC